MAAFTVGAAALAFVLFGPFYHQSGVTTGGERLPGRSHGLIEEGVEWPVALLLAAFSLLLLGVAIGSMLDFRSPGPGPALLLRSSAFILALAVGPTLLAIGGLLAPAAFLAVVSALTAVTESPTDVVTTAA